MARYLNIFTSKACKNKKRVAFQNIALDSEEREDLDLEGLAIVEKWLNDNAVKHGDVITLYARITDTTDDEDDAEADAPQFA